MNYNKSEFVDKGTNGMKYTYIHKDEKVVLYLFSSTETFHVQSKGCLKWFNEIFIDFGKQLHDEVKYYINTQNIDNSIQSDVCDLEQMSPPADSDTSET